MNFTDRIKPTDKGITTYLDELKNKEYQIPTFQRDVVWEEDNVKKLWDSIYKFYPLGSILVWKTDLQLQNHREIGGHIVGDENFDKSEFQYLLDGQQRTTSLLTSLYGGKIDGKDGFDPTLNFDITIQSENETDDEIYNVSDNPIGKQLLELEGEDVKVTGAVGKDSEDNNTITVKTYEIIKE